MQNRRCGQINESPTFRPSGSVPDCRFDPLRIRILWKRIDDHTVEGRINHDDGKEYSTERFVISPEGRKLTLTLLGQRSDGTQSEGMITFIRQ
jgi:hypothetical protein